MDVVLSCLLNVPFLSEVVKNHLICNLSWGGMKGPCGLFPLIVIKIVVKNILRPCVKL